jgi:hypothetical protein
MLTQSTLTLKLSRTGVYPLHRTYTQVKLRSRVYPNIKAIRMQPLTDEQLQQFTPEDQAILVEWWPEVHGRMSGSLGNIMHTPQDVLAHAKLVIQRQQAQPAQAGAPEQHGESFAARWNKWVQECMVRKAFISERKEEIRKRKQERADNNRLWEAYVAEAKKAYDDAHATPVPPQPKK